VGQALGLLELLHGVRELTLKAAWSGRVDRDRTKGCAIGAANVGVHHLNFS
jgi:hypothetical protein